MPRWPVHTTFPQPHYTRHPVIVGDPLSRPCRLCECIYNPGRSHEISIILLRPCRWDTHITILHVITRVRVLAPETELGLSLASHNHFWMCMDWRLHGASRAILNEHFLFRFTFATAIGSSHDWSNTVHVCFTKVLLFGHGQHTGLEREPSHFRRR
jgi:hypothetical protein